jgi:hypothetical protein
VPLAVTSAGLYVAHTSYVSHFRQAEKSLKDIQDLTLADTDYNLAKTFQLFDNLERNLCQHMVLSLHLFSKFQNQFLKIHDINDNPIIIYTSFGNLFVPSCITLGEIQIISNTSRCFEHVPVKFTYKNGTINAFLRDYNIISKTSKSIDTRYS